MASDGSAFLSALFAFYSLLSLCSPAVNCHFLQLSESRVLAGSPSASASPPHTPSLGSDRVWPRGQFTHPSRDARPLAQQQHSPGRSLEMHVPADLKLGDWPRRINWRSWCSGVPRVRGPGGEEGQVGSEWGRVALSRANGLRFTASATVYVLSLEGACVSSWFSAVVQCEGIVTGS